ncbi:RNase P/RNase MRP complex subunit [Coemansia aciculifera]|uniref:Ribonuclease P protein subunit p29 n=1 Tax=Coemansia aciculifera TaxID=417176 RepID=A0A9W8IGT2_9FUNG|nr:RNase P/RNase MRP complex subunit [Coemansia aciculifera]KAJ2871350.1 RNase P/RNase MRP complex subunit [Coemansia aciculifera]
MSDNNNPENIGFYTALPSGIKTRSGAPLTVPLDTSTQKFTAKFIERSVNPTVSDIRATSAFKDRVEGRQLLLTNSFKDTKHARKSKKSGRKTITAKERRVLGIYDIPKESQKYSLFQPLHQLWTQYINGVVGDKSGEQMLGRVIRADMHGAKLGVTKAKCPNYVGVSGIVAQETKNVFRVITQDNRLVVVPKAHCVFALELPKEKCLIYGDQFVFRASERAVKKFKPKPSIDL